jgi:hypothetical protein
VQVLDSNKNLIEAATEFVSHDIEYRWADTRIVPDDELARVVPRIERVCRSLAVGDQIDDSELNEFVRLGLAHRLPGRPNSYIKVYIALTRIPSAIEDTHEYEHVLGLLDTTTALLEDVSIYRGIGFANYLIKGMVSEFEKINEVTVTLLEPAIQRYQLRPTTLIIANNDAPQSDEVDSEDVSYLSLSHLEFWLGVDYAALIEKLSQAERDSLARIFSKFHELLGTPFSTILEGLFLAKLKEDPFLLGQKLIIIMKVESLLGRFFVDLYKTKLRRQDSEQGSSWFQVVRDAATLCSVAEGKSPVTDYTLHDYIVVTNKLIATGKLSRKDVEDVLGVEWNERLDRVKDVRNDIAHGRVFQNQYVKEKWEDVANAVCNIGDIYNALVLRYEVSV